MARKNPKLKGRVFSDVDLLDTPDVPSRVTISTYLGGGAFSEVYRGTLVATSETVAIKIVDLFRCSGKDHMIRSEVRILQQVDHPNIVVLKDIFETESKIYIVMDLVEGGDAFERISVKGKLGLEEVANAMVDMLRGIRYLHENGITHRDLKLENLLYQTDDPDSTLKIADFGLSYAATDKAALMMTSCGTPGYVAPEVLRRQGYTSMADLWSVGVIAYTMLCGYPPFYEETNAELFKQITAGNYGFDSPYWDDIPDMAKEFVSGFLNVNADERMNVAQALVHRFLHRYSKRDLSSERTGEEHGELLCGRPRALEEKTEEDIGVSVETVVESTSNLATAGTKVAQALVATAQVTVVGEVNSPTARLGY